MINAIGVPSQEVLVNQPVLYPSNRFHTGCSARHEQGSGSIAIFKPGIYEISFSGTVSTTAVGTAILNVTIDGEPIPAAQIKVTTAADAFYPVSIFTMVRVFCSDTARIAVVNVSETPVTVANANIIVERICG